MTIAGLYLSPEGIVLGADSTSSFKRANGYHYFNFAQKLFEIGQDSTFGILTWGMGGIGNVSYRALIATLGDDLKAQPPVSVAEVADRWIDIFWPLFSAYPEVVEANRLNGALPHDPEDPDRIGNRTYDEEEKYRALCSNLAVGFCIAGYAECDRVPTALVIIFEACSAGQPLSRRTHTP